MQQGSPSRITDRARNAAAPAVQSLRERVARSGGAICPRLILQDPAVGISAWVWRDVRGQSSRPSPGFLLCSSPREPVQRLSSILSLPTSLVPLRPHLPRKTRTPWTAATASRAQGRLMSQCVGETGARIVPPTSPGPAIHVVVIGLGINTSPALGGLDETRQSPAGAALFPGPFTRRTTGARRTGPNPPPWTTREPDRTVGAAVRKTVSPSHEDESKRVVMLV
jgi:hypothetical protein